ncbi:MAG: hypothetical protein ABJG47_16025 [Ekhidna sp.]
MNSSFKGLLIIIMSTFSCALFSQEINLTEEVHTLLPSPDVAQMNKFVDVPVSLYTGQMNLSVPIYEIKMNHFAIPIALQYNSSGIKVDEPASWIGAGWTMTGEGAVSRNVNGLPDENLSVAKGLFHNTRFFDANGIRVSDLSECGDDFLTAPQIPESVPDSIAMGYLDFEPDVFYLASPLGNLKFVFDHNRQMVPYEDTDIEIEEHPFEDLSNIGTKWIIKTPNGVTMEFEALEAMRSQSGCTSNGAYYVNSARILIGVKSAWKITKIHNGIESVTFEYEDDSLAVDRLYSETTDYGLYGSTTKSRSCQTEIKYHTKYLKKISTTSGVIVDFHSSGRADLAGRHKLDSVTVTQHGRFKKRMVLENDDSLTKLRLLSAFQVDENGQSLPGHTFNYYAGILPDINEKSQDYWGYNNDRNNTTLIPDYKSGVYHFETSSDREPNLSGSQVGALRSVTYPTGGESVFTYELHDYFDEAYECTKMYVVQTPPGEIDSIEFSVNTATNFTWTNANYVDTDFDGGGTQYSILEIQKLDNGSYITYTPATTIGNRFLLDSGAYRLYSENHEIGEDLNMRVEYEESCPQKNYVGGLRISKVEFKQAGETSFTKEYEYEGLDGVSSGLLFSTPLFGGFITSTLNGSIAENEGGLEYCVGADVSSWLTVSSSPTIATFSGTHLGYSQVKEIISGTQNDNGFILHEFTNEEFPGFNYPPVSYVDKGITNGKLLSQVMLSVFEDTVQLTTNQYEEVNSSTVAYGLKASRKHTQFCYDCSGSDFTEDFAASFYEVRPKWHRLKETRTYSYEGQNELVKSQVFEYGSDHTYPEWIKSTTSDSDTLQNHIIREDTLNPGLVTESIAYLKTPNATEKISQKRWSYQEGLPIEESVWNRQSDTMNREGVIVRDALGNVMSYQQLPDNGGTTSVYLRAFDGARVVAEITNTSQAEIDNIWAPNTIAELYVLEDNVVINQRLESLRLALLDLPMHMRIFKYDAVNEVFGPSEIIDFNGKSVKYEYDTFGRLILIRDYEDHALKQFQYTFSNQ